MIVYFTYIRSSTFPHIAACDKISFLLRLNNILYYVYTTFLFIHLSMDIWVISTSWLLWVMLTWTLLCKYLSQKLPSVILYTCPEVGWLDHMEVLFLIFWETAILFFKGFASFYSPSNSAQRFEFLHVLISNCYFFFIVGILMGIRLCLIVFTAFL